MNLDEGRCRASPSCAWTLHEQRECNCPYRNLDESCPADCEMTVARTEECDVKGGIEWKAIPEGEFRMGSDNGEPNEQPAHSRRIAKFEMSRTELTVEQYKACVEAGACTQPARGYPCNWGVTGREKHPVNCVRWEGARAYAEWSGHRLPSEAQWEYAARSLGQDRVYPWGSEAPGCDRAVMPGCGDGTQPVCSRSPEGDTAQGLCDMAGNVWKWAQDTYHDSYEGAPEDGRPWEDARPRRVLRGGSWYDHARYLRSANRSGVDPFDRWKDVGFRLVKSSR